VYAELTKVPMQIAFAAFSAAVAARLAQREVSSEDYSNLAVTAANADGALARGLVAP